MRSFIVMCLLAVACAEKSGYNYQTVAEPSSGYSFATSASATDAQYKVPSAEYVASKSDAVSSYSPPSYDSPAELEKEFYTFTAPEAEFEDAYAAQRIAASVKQGLRVVFIKGPENKAFEEAALALAKQAAQKQTAIYVLNKQTDIGELADKFNVASRNANSKPEVHFVKYRTDDDAKNAQNAIQSQYDSLGGSSRSVNGGFAPVINFATQAAIRTATAQEPKGAYLPSSLFRRH